MSRPRPLADGSERHVRSCPTRICLALTLAAAAPASGAEFSLDDGIPFIVREHAGLERVKDPVTFGFPLAADDDVRSVDGLVVEAPSGSLIPAQFRVLQRYAGGPDAKQEAIRWVLVDAQVDVAAGQDATYLVRKRENGEALPKPPKLKVKKKKSNYIVETGTAIFELNGKTMNFLSRLNADLNGDGKVTKKEKLIANPAGAGFVLADRLGAEYGSARGSVTLTVEEQGPMRTVIRADGLHEPLVDGGGIGRDFFQYRTRFFFYAGKPYVRVLHTLRNAYLDAPLGNIGFESYVMTTSLAGSGTGGTYSATFGLDADAAFSADGPARLYQDSDGGAKWNLGENTTFQGFRVYGDDDSVLASGLQANGSMYVGTGTRGISLAMRDFFQNYPKAFELGPDGRISFHIFPAETASFHWLDDGQQKTTDFLVCAHGKKGPDPTAVVGAFLDPLRPFAHPDWTRASKAWGDQGDLDDPPQSDAVLANYEDGAWAGQLTNGFNQSSFAFGWSTWGEPIWAKNTHTTGSPRNKLTYFDKFALVGQYSSFRVSESFALHSRDIRTYHIDGFTQEAHPTAVLWEGLPPWQFSPDKIGRDALDSALAPHKAGIPVSGHGWNGFDIEHMVADDLYEYYLLTGDPVTLDSLREMGEVMRTWPIYDPTESPGTTRGTGWGLRALVKIWQVTGDERVLHSANALVTAIKNTYGNAPSPLTGLVYHYITRNAPHPNHIADAEYDLPWQLATVIHGMLLHHRETGSADSRAIALDVADYLVDYGWSGAFMHEAMSCDDHNNLNPMDDNAGINTWIPSALALAFRQEARPEYLYIAQTMYNSVPSLTQWNTYNGSGIYHWWHNYRSLILGF